MSITPDTDAISDAICEALDQIAEQLRIANLIALGGRPTKMISTGYTALTSDRAQQALGLPEVGESDE